MVKGFVVDAAGAPNPHAVAALYAWPDQDALTSAPEGTGIALELLGVARANGQGRFSFGPSDAAFAARARLRGYANVEMVVLAGSQQMVYDFSLAPENDASRVSRGHLWRVQGAEEALLDPDFEFDFQNQRVRRGRAEGKKIVVSSMSQRLSALYRTAMSSTEIDAQSKGTVTPDAGGTCYIVPGAITYNVKERFVNAYTYGGSIPAKVTVGATATHTMGVAFSLTGSSWSSSGTSSITRSSSTSASQTYSYSHSVYNRVNYQNYANSCTGAQQKAPYSFYSLLTADGTDTPIAWYYYCSHHEAGTSWNTGSATSTTITAGVTLPVISLSAQSGFSASLDIGFTFNIPGEVCGNSSAGPSSSSIVQADPF